ncbi:MAG: ATP-binding protein [Pirellulales bacterium]
MTSAETSAPRPLCVWYLEGIGDGATAPRYVMSPFPYPVGRQHAAGLWLPQTSVSKKHAEFDLRDGQLILRDLGSTNGTFVNAERLSGETVIVTGDLVHFANVGFRVAAWRHVECCDTAVLEPLKSALELEINERRRAEEALWNAEAMWRALVDAATDGIILIDVSGRIQSFNRAAERLFGYTWGEIQGRNVGLLMPSPEREEHERYIERYLQTSVARIIGGSREVIGRRKDNSTFPINLTVSEIWLADRRMFAGIVRDVSDEKEAAESLRLAKQAAEQANQAKSEFLANMSHEIRTPMSAILGYADLLLAEEGIDRAPSHRIDAFRTIQRNGEHLLQVINDILDLSKVEAGKLAFERIRCSPSELLFDVQRIVKQPAAAKNLPFHIDFVGEIPETIETDPTRLRQVLVNLIGNAVKFTEAGSVTLSVRLVEPSSDSPRMEFAVADTGLGMTPEQIARLFQPFSQADASTSRRFGGTGLGLTICKRIIDHLGGEILVESESGKGSTFRAIIPIGSLTGIKQSPLTWQSPTTPKETSPKNEPTDELNCRILLAEDGPDNQRLLMLLLSKAGAQVTLAENGQAAVDLVLAATRNAAQGDTEAPGFDVILMDMQMPVLDGYQATRKLRAAGCRTPIIALTAHAMQGDRQHCLAAGCDDYLTKPINRHALCAAIRKHLPVAETASM